MTFSPDLETGFGDDKWLLLYRHQGYSFQVELTIIMDISSDLSVCLYSTCWPLRAHHLRITNTLPKGWKEWGRGFAQAALCLCSRRGKMVQAYPKQSIHLPQLCIPFPTQNLRGSHRGWRRPVQRVTRFLIPSHLLPPKTYFWPFIFMTL